MPQSNLDGFFKVPISDDMFILLLMWDKKSTLPVDKRAAIV